MKSTWFQVQQNAREWKFSRKLQQVQSSGIWIPHNVNDLLWPRKNDMEIPYQVELRTMSLNIQTTGAMDSDLQPPEVLKMNTEIHFS